MYLSLIASPAQNGIMRDLRYTYRGTMVCLVSHSPLDQVGGGVDVLRLVQAGGPPQDDTHDDHLHRRGPFKTTDLSRWRLVLERGLLHDKFKISAGANDCLCFLFLSPTARAAIQEPENNVENQANIYHTG